MTFLKFVSIITFIMAVTVTSVYTIDNKIVNAVHKVVLVEKSTTCVILVVEDKVKFVSTEADAPNELTKWRNATSKTNLQIIKSSFRPLYAKDVLEKLAKIAKIHSNFLAYFTVSKHKSLKGSITAETTKPVGLVGKLLAALGLKVEEKGLLAIVLSILGINANEKDVEIIEFEY